MGKKLYKKDTLLSPENCLVITDDGSGLTKAEVEKLKILSIPLSCKVLGEKPKNFNSNENLDDFFSVIKNERAEKVVSSVDAEKVYKILRSALLEYKFVVFSGTGESFSSMNTHIRKSLKLLSEKMPKLRAKNRLIILNTSCVSGGLGYYLNLMVPFIYSGKHTVGEVFAYNQFLANHIVHKFTSSNFDFVEESRRFSSLNPALTKKSIKKIFRTEEKKDVPLMHVPRTGRVNAKVDLFRGRRLLYNHLASEFRDFTYNQAEEVWVVYGGLKTDETYNHARELVRQIKRCCPEAKIDMSHRLTPAVCAHSGDEVVGLVYLSRDIRPDEPYGKDFAKFEAEAEEKRRIMKRYITEISKISRLYLNELHPDLSTL